VSSTELPTKAWLRNDIAACKTFQEVKKGFSTLWNLNLFFAKWINLQSYRKVKPENVSWGRFYQHFFVQPLHPHILKVKKRLTAWLHFLLFLGSSRVKCWWNRPLDDVVASTLLLGERERDGLLQVDESITI
jgi:hypothetical protein